MPQFFFHLRLQDQRLEDPSGQSFPDADAAWEAARAAARDLMQNLQQPLNWQDCLFEVAGEDGEVLFEFPFLEAIEIPSPPQ